MGSLEEEKLFQMVHDFIESESSPPIFSSSPESPTLNHHAKYYFSLKEILGSNTDGEAKVMEKVLKHMRNKMDAKKTSSVRKSVVMRLKREGYNASLCQTSWPTTSGCPGGGYEYIDIVMEDENNGISVTRRRRWLIVDIDFKSQFELARPTSAYKELTSTLPPVFVGEEQKLSRVIPLLCSAAKQSFRERGLHIPPWRTITYMQSKWLSPCSHKDKGIPTLNREVGKKGSRELQKVGALSTWAPPVAKPNRRDAGGGSDSGSGLSRQFSNMSTKCC